MPEMDYDLLEAAITERTKAIIVVDLAGIVADYDRVYEIVRRKKRLFRAMDDHSDPLKDLGSRIQAGLGRVAVVCDAAHALGASRITEWSGKGKGENKRRWVGNIADFTSFSFHAVKNITSAEGGAAVWAQVAGVCQAVYMKRRMTRKSIKCTNCYLSTARIRMLWRRQKLVHGNTILLDRGTSAT